MVSAVSSQAATLNPLAYTTQTESDTTKQAALEAEANNADRGPATVVSFSQAAQDMSAAGLQWGQDRLSEFQVRAAEVHKQLQINQLNYQLQHYDWQQETNKHLTDTIKRLQDTQTKWMATTPVPAVQLTADQIKDILKKVAPRGIDPGKMGGADTYSFGDDGKIYTFLKDGTAWVHESGVPTSEQEKQGVYQAMTESMLYMSTRFEYPSVSREDLVAQRDALMAQ
jgi:hypothetical protein